MHNRALHDSLAAFVEEAAWQLAEEIAGGAEVPFELIEQGRARFCELERSLEGISPRTLSLRLRALEEAGIVARQTFPEVPPRVEYALTDKGRALVPIIETMRVYGREWLNDDGACVEKPEPAEPAVAAA